MIKPSWPSESIFSLIAWGFSASSLLLIAMLHPQISYVVLLGFSALFRTQPVSRVLYLMQRLISRHKLLLSGGSIATLLAILTALPASAAWDSAQEAADTAFGTYIGADSGIDIISILFTTVFLILFFMIVGGLMSWGVRSFRNEEAAASITAFVVGAVIFVGGEVFSRLFFGAPSGAATEDAAVVLDSFGT